MDEARRLDGRSNSLSVPDRRTPSVPASQVHGAEAPPSWSRELVKKIAMDIGKDTVAYVEIMYPEAIKATSSTFRLSLRNHIHNQIMAAIEVNDAGQIAMRLQDRAKHRREMRAAWKKIRETDR